MNLTSSLSARCWQDPILALLLQNFRQEWQAGRQPRIEDYLERVSSAHQPALRTALACLELQLSLEAGQQVRAEDYLARHPELASDMSAVRELIETELRQRPSPCSGQSTALSATRATTPGFGATIAPEPSASSSSFPAIASYEILAVLGRGGMGVVYKAKQLGLDRLVALKMILAGTASEEELGRFRAEAQALARLRHPNIVQIHDIGMHDGKPYFSLEYIEGGSLDRRTGGQPHNARQAAQMLETLARAVHAAHEAGIIHRDLKPHNVLISEKGELKIADFGLAKSLDSASAHTQTGAVLGTPSYMAPEQAEGRTRAVGPRTDVYGLGAILYELLTGKPPFRGASVPATLEMVCTRPPDSPGRLVPGLPRDLEVICLKCLEKRPEDRYLRALDLADDLRRFLDGHPIQARPVGVGGRVWRWGRRHPLAAAGTALAFVALVILTAVWLTRPAYLDLSVTPVSAEVTLDGEGVSLSDGRALVESRPGPHRLMIRAEGFRPYEEEVALTRGRGNALVAGVELKSLYGRFTLDTKPAGARIAVRSSDGQTVARGTTPYSSPRLLAGTYQVHVQIDNAEPKVISAAVPEGDETVEIAAVKLEVFEPGVESQKLLALLHDWNDKPYDIIALDDPKITLEEVIELLSKKTGATVEIDTAAFEKEDIKEVEKFEIVGNRFLPEVKQGSLGRWLDKLLQRLPEAATGVWEPARFSSARVGIRITTRKAALETRTTLFHPVGDLIEPGNDAQMRQLLADLRGQLGRKMEEKEFDVRYASRAGAIQVTGNWFVQRNADRYLREAQAARRAGAVP